MNDRRLRKRSTIGRVARPIERRRSDDRRDWVRMPIHLEVREIGGGPSLSVREGEIGVGGASWMCDEPPARSDVEVRFTLPEDDVERWAMGEVVRIRRLSSCWRVHVRFVVIDVLTELAIARRASALAPVAP